jgi:hypothetical protein
MDIIKKTTLQGFSISVLALAMVACGGSSDDSAPAATPTPNTGGNGSTLTTPNEVAKAAAAIVAANTTFDELVSIGKEGIADRISKGLGNGQNLTCNRNAGAPTFTVVANTATANTTDGTRTYPTDCPDGEYLSRGKIVFTCTDAACDANSAEFTNYMEAVPTILSPTINGTAASTFANNTYSDVYKGSVKLEKNGSMTTFSFADGLMRTIPKQSDTWTTATGKIMVSGGNALNCTTDGEFSYQATVALKDVQSGGIGFESGALKISTGTAEAGTVTFATDGSVKVKMAGQSSETTIPKSTFESYCGLGAVAQLNAKFSTD